MRKRKEVTNRLRTRWLAIGSALDFWPANDDREFPLRGRMESRIGGYWDRTGQYLRTTLETKEQSKCKGP